MTTVLLVIHLFVTLALIGVVLIQRSEGGGLGIGTTGGMGSFMGGRGTTNLLTRTTAILATIFMLLSLTLALLNRGTAGVGRSILDDPAPPASTATQPSIPSPVPPRATGDATVPATPAPAATVPAATAPAPAAAPAAPAAPVPAAPVPAAPVPAAPVPAAPVPAAPVPAAPVPAAPVPAAPVPAAPVPAAPVPAAPAPAEGK